MFLSGINSAISASNKSDSASPMLKWSSVL